MENHHAAAAFSILLEEDNNFLSEQPRKVIKPAPEQLLSELRPMLQLMYSQI